MIDVDLNGVATPLDWTDLFGREAPTDIEIGSGKGRFLFEMATAHPERDFLAVERAAKYHALCCQRAAKRGLTNVRVLRTTAEDLLFRLVPRATVENIYVLFPDPWPKKRHHKRRLVKPENVAAMANALVCDGRLLVKSDYPDYADVISEVLAAEPILEAIDPTSAFDVLPITEFEYKYREEGREIFAFAYRRVVTME